ncbi:DEAD/DEAH box helicase [Xylanivirga thermophila]|uniref:DEAD/DEAH box helicase n=1 Tax=Xylanivirga thermophila TaxID=2496273 RepID=UPI00101DF970|nr:DEAD/DEAH box helicase [Xylanivirga thermophila]
MSNFKLLCEPIKNGIITKLGWRNLTPVQELTIPEIIDGKNIVVLAPTAGGKTEAAFLPVLNAMYIENLKPISIIYVSPIKALLNNQEERLGKLSSFVYSDVFKWHGDVESSEKQKFYKNPSQVLMITPESLEVILMSQKIDKKQLLANIRFIVIDEIHAFADSERGIHLMAVMERIQSFSRFDIQRIGLSATVGNPHEILKWMHGSSTREGIVINPPKEKKPKKIEIKYVDEAKDDFQKDIAKRIFGKKALFFSNSRTAAEELKLFIEGNGIDCHVHHSSINKYFREIAEEKFKVGNNTAIIATSTLELGIDIGDLDIVLQLDSPNSVSSFLQRLGRTGRRENSIAHFVFFPTDKGKLVFSIAILNLAIRGWVEDIYLVRNAYDILFQQILAITLSTMGTDLESIYELFKKVYSFSEVSKEDFIFLVKYMIKNKYLMYERGKVFIDTETEKKFGSRNFITLYSAFDTNKEFTVKYKNRPIGNLERWFVNALGDNFQFVLAGRCWQTDKIDYDRGFIHVIEAEYAKPPKWMSEGGFVSFELAQEYLNVLTSNEAYNFLNKTELDMLNEIRYEEKSFGLERGKILIEESKNDYIFYTYAGNRVNYTLATTLSLINIYYDIVGLTWKGFKLRCRDKEFKIDSNIILEEIKKIRTSPNYFGQEKISELIEKVPDINISKFQKYLPQELRRKQLFDYIYDIKKTREFIRYSEIKVLKIYY